VVRVSDYRTDMYCFLWGTNWIYICYVKESRLPLWSSDQSSWLQSGDVLCFPWGTNWIYIYCGRKLMFLVRRADNLTAIWADCLDNVEFLTSHNPIGLHGLLRRWLYFLLFYLLETHCTYLHMCMGIYIMNDKTYLSIHTVYISTLICPLKMTVNLCSTFSLM
jgi:hypothetical protein